MIRIRDSYRAPGKVRVVYVLLFLNLVSFMAATYGGQDHRSAIFALTSVIPAEFGAPELLALDLPADLLAARLPWYITIIWYTFLHAGWPHLLSNGIALWLFGPNVEIFLGRTRFLLFYFSCGAVGALCQILFDLESTKFLVGASGAISGLFGAYFAVFPGNYLRITLGSLATGQYRDFMVPIKMVLLLWLILQFFNLIFPQPAGAQDVALLTHLGGFFCGYFLAGGKSGLLSTKRNFKVFLGGRSRKWQ